MGEQLDAEEKAVQPQWFILRDKSKQKTGWGFVSFYTNSRLALNMAGELLEVLEDALDDWLRIMTQREENVGQDDVGSVKQDRG